MIGGEIFNLIRQTGAVAQVVLVILLIFSIMSWSVILDQVGLDQTGARAERTGFCARSGKRSACRTWPPSPNSSNPARWWRCLTTLITSTAARATRTSRRCSGRRRLRLQKSSRAWSGSCPGWRPPGAVAPFIGLFGTVWGIIDAFNGLGDAGAATLRAVAPGISEALITTAVWPVCGHSGGDRL